MRRATASFLVNLVALIPHVTVLQAAGISTGSGVVIGAHGEILTNSHVVENCEKIRVQLSSPNSETAVLIANDRRNDLAVIKTETTPGSVAAFRDGHGVRAGDTVVALGYPLAGYLATNANLSVGNVSALAGLGDDSRYVQISAPVQPGNSGGPLLDTSGHIVGVVASRLNGGGVQNVNFALKAEVARTFLDSKGITYRTAASEQQLSPADVGEMARPFTVFIECQQKRPASIAVIARTEASPPSRTAAQWKDELVNYCRNLYKDKRLDAVRGVLSFADAPTLSQQRNPNFITNEQRPALDAWKELYEKCNNKLAAVNPQVWKFFRQFQPQGYANLNLLYDKKITIGEYNTRKQELLNRVQAAVAEQVR